MKVSKAIELLKLHQNDNLTYSGEDIFTATKLGIEALKRIQKLRNPINSFPNDPLLGETPENEK